MNRKSNRILAVFLMIILICSLSGCSGKVEQKTEKDYSNIEMNPNIAIPGYESLEFKAGKEKQSVDFYNPDENTCYFRISLVIEGSEGVDEDVLWTSDLIEPGENIKNIELNKELESGEYPAILQYECFSLKDETPLNGSNISLKIEVR